MREQEAIRLVVTIVERGAGNRVAKAYSARQISAHHRCEGRGTATSEILDILGLGSTEKDVVLSLATAGAARGLMEELDDQLGPQLNTKGIAFTMPLTGLSNLLATAVQLTGRQERKEGSGAVRESGSSLILITVNQGFTGEVMETAKKAGARGGTILRARWTGLEGLGNALALDQEREIIAIVAPDEKRRAIMDAVNTAHGVRSQAGGSVLSLAVEQLVKI